LFIQHFIGEIGVHAIKLEQRQVSMALSGEQKEIGVDRIFGASLNPDLPLLT